MGNESPLVLAFDVGLTRVKTGLVDLEGTLVGSAAVAYPTRRNRTRLAEQDPKDWWDAMKHSAGLLGARHSDAIPRVAAVSVTGHMHALLCVDSAGEPLGPAIVLGDTRAKDSAAWIANELSQSTIHRITGTRLEASMPAAKISWIAEHEADQWSKTSLVMGVKDYIRMRLTGDKLTDPIDATATSLFDIGANRWSPEMLEAAGVSEDRLPEVRPPESFAGELLTQSAVELGLKPGIPVVVGAGDDIEVLGRGLIEHGSTLEHIGTTGSILCVLDRPIFDPALALEIYPHALPGLWVLGGSMTAAGAAIEWAARTLGFDSVSQSMESLTSRSERNDAPLFLPNLAGSRVPEWNSHAKGAWVSLGIVTDREDLMYASFEGVAFGLAEIFDLVTTLAASRSRLRATGASDEDSWLRVRVAAYGESLAVSDVDSTAIGAAMLAAGGLGLHKDVHSAVAAMKPRERVIEPDQDHVASLKIRRSRFRAAAEAMGPVWLELADGGDHE